MNVLLTQSWLSTAIAILLIRKTILTGVFYICPNLTEIFEKSDVYGYKNGNIHYYCLQAKFTDNYLCKYTPESGFPYPNSEGHLFFISPLWKIGQIPTGCVSECRVFNPLSPWKSEEPKVQLYNSVSDALEMCSENVSTNFYVPNKTHCNCNEENCRKGYIGFKIDTTTIASQVVRYSFSISKMLCWISSGAFAAIEAQKGMNASANQHGVTDCPPGCDCTNCPICCEDSARGCPKECPHQCTTVIYNGKVAKEIVVFIADSKSPVICKTLQISKISWHGPNGDLISLNIETKEHTLQLQDILVLGNGTYECKVVQTDYCGNSRSSSTSAHITTSSVMKPEDTTTASVVWPAHECKVSGDFFLMVMSLYLLATMNAYF